MGSLDRIVNNQNKDIYIYFIFNLADKCIIPDFHYYSFDAKTW